MFGDGIRHGVRLSVVARIIASHDALQFGEFMNHTGTEVGLAQKRRLVGFPPGRARRLGQGHGKRANALHLSVHCPKPGVENDIGELRTRLSRVAARSASQWNPASDKRARRTRRFPATTAPPPSAVSMLETTMNLSARDPSPLRQTKYFWCVFTTAVSTSSGSSMKPGSIAPINGVGHSTRPVTSSAKPSSSFNESPPLPRASGRDAGSGPPLGGVQNNLGLKQLLLVIGKVGDREWLGRQEAVTRRAVAHRDIVTSTVEVGQNFPSNKAITERGAEPNASARNPNAWTSPGQLIDDFR